MYKAGKKGRAGKKTPGPQRIELLLQLGDLHIHCKSVGDLPGAMHMALGLEKPQEQAGYGPCSRRAYSLAKRPSRNRELQSSVKMCWLGRLEIGNHTYTSLRLTQWYLSRKKDKKKEKNDFKSFGPFQMPFHSLKR